jgi:hypothetical protein
VVTMPYDDFSSNRLKHMELIQAVVSRLAGNSFLVKGGAITLAAALGIRAGHGAQRAALTEP